MFALIALALGLVGLLAPLLGSIYAVRFATGLMMWIALTQSLNTITGYIGRVDFGHVLFFGVGAYVTAVLFLNGAPWPLAVAAAPLAAAGLAAALGYPTLRLHGAYFAIATWSFAEAFKQIVFNTPELGASFGLPIPPTLGYVEVLYLMTGVALLALAINWAVERSRLGLAFNAIRGNELVASTLGVNVVGYRLLGYVLSSIPAALAGAVYVFWVGYVYPGDVFHGLKTDQMFVMLLLGGAGSYVGALLGSIIVAGVYEVLWTYFSEQLYLVFLGLMLSAIVVFMPRGLAHHLGLRTYSARALFASLVPPPLAARLALGERAGKA